jgi:hypothetical protein
MSPEAGLVTALARARGVTEQVIRLEHGIREAQHICEECGHVWVSREAAMACATYDDQRD